MRPSTVIGNDDLGGRLRRGGTGGRRGGSGSKRLPGGRDRVRVTWSLVAIHENGFRLQPARAALDVPADRQRMMIARQFPPIRYDVIPGTGDDRVDEQCGAFPLGLTTHAGLFNLILADLAVGAVRPHSGISSLGLCAVNGDAFLADE